MSIRFSLLLVIGILLLNSCKENQKNTLPTSANSTIDKSQFDSYFVDTFQSNIFWKGSSPASSHAGNLKFLNGILYSKNKILKSAELNIDMHTISTIDIQDPSDKNDLENHLKSADFFSVDSFPIANYKMSSITMISDSVFNAIINGALTIKDVTRSLKARGKVVYTDETIIVDIPDFTIDRTQYNIMYQSKKLLNTLKDEFLNDDVVLSIKLVARKKL